MVSFHGFCLHNESGSGNVFDSSNEFDSGNEYDDKKSETNIDKRCQNEGNRLIGMQIANEKIIDNIRSYNKNVTIDISMEGKNRIYKITSNAGDDPASQLTPSEIIKCFENMHNKKMSKKELYTKIRDITRTYKCLYIALQTDESRNSQI